MRKIILILFIILLATQSWATTFYVDNAATGSNNGTSWSNAWESLANISWASVQAGDTIYISGGAETKTYSERLVVGSSGTAGNPITIQVGQDEGHTGVVVLDGTSVGNYYGIAIAAKSYIKISGQVGSGIGTNMKIQNFYYSGVNITGSSSNIEIAYIETEQNNQANGSGSHGLYVNNPATLVTGLVAEIHHCKFHNNVRTTEVRFYQTYTGTRLTYDQVKFHHNEVYDEHADWITIQMEGVSLYNNQIHSRGTYVSDHPDGIQAWSGYCKIYNNTFYGFHREDDNNVNSYIRFNPQTTNNPNPAYIWIYNNLFYEQLPLTFAPGTNVRRGIELAPQDGTTLNHLYFMNNTMVGTNLFGLFIGFKSTHTTANVSDIIIVNNLFQDCAMTGGGVVLFGSGGDGSITYGSWREAVDVIFDYNVVSASSGTWSTNILWADTTYAFEDFIALSGTNTNPSNATHDPLLDSNYMLTSSSPYVNAGVDLSSYFTTDKNGSSRTNWSIGAYEYGGTADTTHPTISSATINTDGNTLTLVFSEPVTVNTSTGFTLNMSGGAAGLTYTSGSGTNTLDYVITGRNIDDDETGTLDYATVANGIEDAAGNDLASTGESDITVTNKSTYSPSATTYVVTVQSSGNCVVSPLSNQVIVSGQTASHTCTASGNSGCATWTGTCGGTGTTSFTTSAITGNCTVIQGCYKISPDTTIGSGATVTIGSGAAATIQ